MRRAYRMLCRKRWQALRRQRFFQQHHREDPRQAFSQQTLQAHL